MDAGRAWARPVPIRHDDDLSGDAAFWGLTLEQASAPRVTEIWECHRSAWEAFVAASRQWRTAPVGMGAPVWVGLDAAAAEASLRMAGITVTPTTWAEVQAIETGAIEELNRRG